MARLRSWYGDRSLRQAVLDHLDADHESATLRELCVPGRGPLRYWRVEDADLDAMRAALGLPRKVLAFGLAHGGILENEAGIRWVIDAVRRFLCAIPVGAHIDWVPSELAAWRLDDREHGVLTLVEGDDRITAILARAANALRHALVDDALRAEVAPLLSERRGEIRSQWQTKKAVDPRVYAHCRALETASHALEVPLDDRALQRAVEASVGGMGVPSITSTRRIVEAHFLDLLRGSAGSG